MSPVTFTSAFPEPDARLIAIAESLKPELTRTPLPLRNVVEVSADESSLLGWKAVPAAVPVVEDLPLLDSGKSCILDLGEHIAGFLQFVRPFLSLSRAPPAALLLTITRTLQDVAGLPFEKEPADAPARIKLTFGEVLNDIAEPFEPYKCVLVRLLRLFTSTRR